MNTRFQADTATAAPLAGTPRGAPSPTVVRPVLPRYVLRGVGGAGFGRTFPLVGPTVLGRAPDCDVRLDHPGVSRQHVRFTPTDDGLLVEDLGSTNGWLLNEQREERAYARHGDEIGIDTMRFRVVSPSGGQGPAARTRPAALAGAAPAKASGASPWWWLAALAVLGAVAMLALR